MPELPPDHERGADWEAVVKLYFEHRIPARQAAGWILGFFDAEIEDVIHDAIIKAVHALHTLHEPERARGWFCRIVSNQAYDLRRARLRRGGKESPVGSARDLELLPTSARGMLPEEFPLLRAGFKFINTLPEKQRVAYLLEHFIGLDREDIAHVLGCSQKTVSTHLRRAQAKVDKKFSPAPDLAKKKQRAQLGRSEI